MILYYVAQRPHRVVERATVLDPEGLRHGDLDVGDVAAVPDRLEEVVREAEDQDVLHRVLAEIMVDAEDLLLVEHREEMPIERTRGLQVASEGLLDHDAGICREFGVVQLDDDLLEERRRDLEVEERPSGAHPGEGRAERAEQGGVGVVAAQVAHAPRELREHRLVE